MASFKQYTASGGATENFSINSFSSDEIKVRVDGVLKTAATHYNITNYTANGGTVTWTSGNVPSSGTVRIYRITDLDPARATFSTGSSLKAQDLNDNQTQVLRGLEEENDQLIQTYDIEDSSITSAKILDGTIVNADVNASAAIDGTKISPNFGSQVIQTTGNITVGGTVDSRDVNADGTKLDTIETNAKDDQTAAEIRTLVDAATDSNVFTNADHTKLDNIATEANKYVHPNHSGDVTSVADGATTIANDAVTFAKFQNIAQDTILGRNLSGTGDPTALTSGEVRTLLNVENGATADQTDAEIKTAYENNSNTNAFTDSDKNFIADIDATATEINVLDGITSTTAELNFVDGVTSNVQTQLNAKQALDAELTELATMSSGTASALADLTQTEVQVLDGVTATTAELNVLDGVTASTTELNMMDNCTAVGTELSVLDGITANTSELNILDGVTSSTAELNLLDGKSIVTTIAANATDVQIPSAQAVNERIVTVMQDAGGFVPIANEVSFPNTNPDPNDDAGTIVSIADAGGLKVADGSGSGTYAGTAGHSLGATTAGGTAVTITGIDSSLQGTTIAAGKGMLVETTSTLNTYTYHRLVVDEAGVAAAQTLVNDFNQRYRVGSTNPTSSLDDGDLFFNTTSDKMLVYNSTGSSWDEVQSVGNFFINTISSYSGTGGNSATFNGSAYRFVLSNAGTYAQQHIVSVNGVIQKPNSGTSQPAEGFAIDGSSILFSAAPASGSDYFIITVGASVNIGAPSNNTVTSAMIVDGSIVNADISSSAAIAQSKLNLSITNSEVNASAAIAGSKLADDSITEVKLDVSNTPTNGQFLQAQSGEGGGLTWASVTSTPEGTAILSTGETGTAKFLRIDGDNSCSWQVPPDTNTNVLAGGTITGDVIFDNATNAGNDLTWDMSDNALEFDDNVQATFGDGADLKIYHNGTNDFIQSNGGYLKIQTDSLKLHDRSDDHPMIEALNNGAVNLYYDNSKKAFTGSTGFNVDGNCDLVSDNNKLQLGNGADLQIYHTGSINRIDSVNEDLAIRRAGTAEDMMIKCIADGAVELYHDGVKRLETTSAGVTIPNTLTVTDGANFDGDVKFESNNGTVDDLMWDKSDSALEFGDDCKAKFGDGGDLQIYHDASNSHIVDSGTGSLLIKGDAVNIGTTGGEYYFRGFEDGACYLRYDNSNKLETISTGINVTGRIALDGAGSIDSTPHTYNYNTGTDKGGLYIEGGESSIDVVSSDDGTHGGTIILRTSVNGAALVYNPTDNALELKTFVTSSDNFTVHAAGGGLSDLDTCARFVLGGTSELYHNNSKKLHTASGGVYVTGFMSADSFYLNDDEKSYWGTGDDLQIYHQNSNGKNYIASVNNELILQPKSGDSGITITPDAGVGLFHNDVKKLETTANGATVTGHISGAHGVIEQFLTPCDGSAIALVNGTETVANVTSATSMSTTYADIPGSEIAYTPPSGTKQVIYKFVFTNSRDGDASSRSHFKLLIDGTEVTNARWSDGGAASSGIDRYNNFEWAINIGGTANAATGRQASWTSDKTIKLQMREYVASYESKVHNVYYWDGANNDPQFHQPSIGITAIG